MGSRAYVVKPSLLHFKFDLYSAGSGLLFPNLCATLLSPHIVRSEFLILFSPPSSTHARFIIMLTLSSDDCFTIRTSSSREVRFAPRGMYELPIKAVLSLSLLLFCSSSLPSCCRRSLFTALFLLSSTATVTEVSEKSQPSKAAAQIGQAKAEFPSADLW